MERTKIVKLGDVLNFKRGHDLPKIKMQDGKIPVAGSNGIIGYHNEETPIHPCITIGRSGNVGTPYIYDKCWAHNTVLYVDDFKSNDPKYLYYLLKTIPLSSFGGGSAVPTLNRNHIHPIEIKYFENIKTQKKKASFLSSLDDKIELNRRINENLEQQAQALFNYYFIEHSEILGDYEKGNLTEIATYTNGLPMQKFRPQDEEKGMPVLKIKELGQGQTDNSSDICSENIANEYKVTNGDVIFSWSGTLMVKVWCGGLCGLNQHLFKVTSEKYPKWYYYFWTKFHLNKFIRIAQDKAVTMGHIRRGDLESSEVLVPKMDILAKLNEIINPIFNQIIGIECENRNLAQLRDTLLPRLMSGELAITDVDDRSIFQ